MIIIKIIILDKSARSTCTWLVLANIMNITDKPAHKTINQCPSYRLAALSVNLCSML